MTDTAVNAVEKMYPVITALRRLEAEMNAAPRHPLFTEWAHPVNLNIGVIRGGDWPSSVPAACTLECRLAYQPGHGLAETQELIREAVGAAGAEDPWLCENPPEVGFFGIRAEPSVADTTSPAYGLLAECHEGVVGRALDSFALPATADNRFFVNDWHMPAFCYGPAGGNTHAADEGVLISSIKDCAAVLALYALRWCGIAE